MKKLLPVLLFFFFPNIGAAAQSAEDQMRLQRWNTDGSEQSVLSVHDEAYRGSGSIAAADFGTDGVQELLLGAGPGMPPSVTMLRQDGSTIASFLAYDPSYDRGITVASCDLDQDGHNEIITGTMYGGGPHVKVFSPDGTATTSFFAYDDTFTGGVHVACGDIDGDTYPEIVTGPGITGGPHVRVFDQYGTLQWETFSGSAQDNTGVSVAVGDLDGNGDMEIITGRAGIGDSVVTVLDLKNDQLRFVLSLQPVSDYTNGINVFAGDIDNDGMDEIGMTTKGAHLPSVHMYEMTGAQVIGFQTSERTDHGLSATVLQGENPSLLTLTTQQQTIDEQDKYIHVDLSTQTLRAYEHGMLVYSSLVSTGVPWYPTPTVRSAITDKLLWHDYRWSYGEDNPNNYAITDVKYNLRFLPHYYLHYAYWHNNFGNVMSHGCVNMAYDDVEWIYNWADVGTIVETTP